ncbi:MAG: 50S ribosomal protein L21e [Nanoarchaeota archaeon]
MPNRVGTARRKTRSKLRKPAHMRGKTNINKFMQTFDQGEHVAVKLDSGYQKGMCHPRFHGSAGVIVGRRGICYVLTIHDGEKQKRLVVHPVHLRRN